jgi:hypothetical protein
MAAKVTEVKALQRLVVVEAVLENQATPMLHNQLTVALD